MNGKERYMRKVLDSVFTSQEARARFTADLESHFDEGREAGESEAEIIRRLGPPDEVAASFMDNVSFHFAGFWIRVLAFMTDLAVCCLVTLPLLCAVFFAFGMERDEAPLAFFMLLIPIAMWTFAVFLLYFPALEAHFGKTLGKHLLGLRVLNENGTRLGLGKAFLRRLSYYFDFLAIDALFAAFTDKKQRALDMLSKTIVVREQSELKGVRVLICLAIIVAPICTALLVILSGGFC